MQESSGFGIGTSRQTEWRIPAAFKGSVVEWVFCIGSDCGTSAGLWDCLGATR